jgi:hypothetical protein
MLAVGAYQLMTAPSAPIRSAPTFPTSSGVPRASCGFGNGFCLIELDAAGYGAIATPSSDSLNSSWS